jgi:molybdate transport system substrate-binding protein
MKRIVCFWSVCLALFGLSACAAFTPAPSSTKSTSNASDNTITVSAAADLTLAFQEIGKRYEQETGVPVVFNFGSTGLLAQQIEQGAPIDLFAAANVSFVEELLARDRLLADTKALYAVGRITLWTRPDSPLKIETLQDLQQPQIKHIAIANPDHAPYGIAAREAMQSAGLWDALQPKLVLGENALATLQYAQRGDVDVAIVPLSLSTQSQGHWVLIPAAMHKPIVQALAVVKGSKHEAEARAFAQFINGPQGRPIMRKYGFILPGESPLP